MTRSTSFGQVQVLVEEPPQATRPPMLFIHGYFADATIWGAMPRFFAARGHPCYAVHLRGRGGTRPDVELGRVSMRYFADDAGEVARALGRPIVVGHSMGGLVAQLVAARDLARALVLFAPAPPRGIPLMHLRLAKSQLPYMPSVLMSRLVKPSARDLREIVLHALPPEDQDRLLAELMPDSGRAGREMSMTGVTVDRERIRCPVLVLAGDEDRFIPLRKAKRVARHYDAPLIVAPGRGHMLVREPGWEELAERVVDWLAGLDDPSSSTSGGR